VQLHNSELHNKCNSVFRSQNIDYFLSFNNRFKKKYDILLIASSTDLRCQFFTPEELLMIFSIAHRVGNVINSVVPKGDNRRIDIR
jgi:hypothetical protein